MQSAKWQPFCSTLKCVNPSSTWPVYVHTEPKLDHCFIIFEIGISGTCSSYYILLTQGLFNFYTLKPAWISSHMPSKVWDEINYPFPNFSGPIKVWLWVSLVSWYFAMNVINNPCMGAILLHVSKRGLWLKMEILTHTRPRDMARSRPPFWIFSFAAWKWVNMDGNWRNFDGNISSYV